MQEEHFDELPFFEPMLNSKTKHKRKKRKAMMGENALSQNKHEPSKMELRIAKYLKELGVSFITEKTFPDLESILFKGQLLPLDFYCKSYNLVIEFDGDHHYKRKYNQTEEQFQRVILNDRTKDLFCLSRGINMLRIRYTDAPYYKELILQELNKIRKKNE